MLRAALGRGSALALLLFAAGLPASGQAPRSAPSRPGSPAGDPPAAVPPSAAPASPLAGRRFGKIDYVALPDVAARLGLRWSWIDRGRRGVLGGGAGPAAFDKDSREALVNGLRVFLGDPVLEAGGQLHVSRIDFERCLLPLLRPSQVTPRPRAPRVVVLDPGHGGRDNGTSRNEKTYALDVARRARQVLQRTGIQVVLTRDEDVFLELPQRAAIANAARADLFVSIHFNALPRDTRTSGVEVFTFAPQHQRSAEAWGPLKADDTEITPSPVNRHDAASVMLAQAVHRRFVRDLQAFDRGKKLAHWGVLRALQCPGVLVECGFLTSEAEARRIATPAYRQQIAEAIADAITDYAVLVAPPRAGG